MRLINFFHLEQRTTHLGSELSGGQQRKLSVAIAVSGGSKFIVLDEPSAGMVIIVLYIYVRSNRLNHSNLGPFSKERIMGSTTVTEARSNDAANYSLYGRSGYTWR